MIRCEFHYVLQCPNCVTDRKNLIPNTFLTDQTHLNCHHYLTKRNLKLFANYVPAISTFAVQICYNLTLFSKPMLQRLQSESVQINTSKYISLHQLSKLWVYIEIKLWKTNA
jgi:hypothetical protein